MSTQPNDGGPAFPLGDFEWTRPKHNNGMSPRDWFAGHVVMGMVACPDIIHETYEAYAKRAYACADAMLAARERKEDAT